MINSQHVMGAAVDLASNSTTWAGIAAAGKAATACREPSGQSGLGHVHLDCGNRPVNLGGELRLTGKRPEKMKSLTRLAIAGFLVVTWVSAGSISDAIVQKLRSPDWTIRAEAATAITAEANWEKDPGRYQGAHRLIEP